MLPEVILYADSNGTHLHQIYTGLILLHQSSRIHLKIKPGLKDTSERPNRQFIRIDVRNSSESHVAQRCLFDLQDSSEIGLANILDDVDFYFKRSLEPQTLDKVDIRHKAKIKPFGLNYQVITGHGDRFFSRLFTEMISRPYNPFAKKNRFHVSNLVDLFKCSVAKKPGALFSCDEIEAQRDDSQGYVLFQCRLWNPEELAHSEDGNFVNNQRIELILALKDSLGAKFKGGLQDTAYARRIAPEIISKLPGNRRNYLKLVNGASVLISTPGLLGSNGWKLTEYVAAGSGIVSNPVRTILPGKFLSGQNYLEFSTAQECVQQSLRLLEDAALLSTMQQCNREYYRTYIRPDNLMFSHILTAINVS
jgi:hypothetical protein